MAARRATQMDTAEAKEAVAHLHTPEGQAAAERHLDAVSAAQGGRWLESSTVEHEGARGYGALHHHPQQSTPEVQAALAGRKSPEFAAADEKLREARADAQGGRWMDEGNMPRDLPSQADQPAVKAALAHAALPEVQEEMERKRAARAAAQGGRWLD